MHQLGMKVTYETDNFSNDIKALFTIVDETLTLGIVLKINDFVMIQSIRRLENML